MKYVKLAIGIILLPLMLVIYFIWDEIDLRRKGVT